MIFQKRYMNNLLSKFNPELTEIENMKNLGYGIIFDCGKDIFIKNNKKDRS